MHAWACSSVFTSGCCASLLLEQRLVLYHNYQTGYRPVTNIAIVSAALKHTESREWERSAWPWMALQVCGRYAVSFGASECAYALSSHAGSPGLVAHLPLMGFPRNRQRKAEPMLLSTRTLPAGSMLLDRAVGFQPGMRRPYGCMPYT